ncbi:MAG: inner membrane protein YpjD [Chthoniobacterales bacterium]
MEQERMALLGSTFFYFFSCCWLFFIFKTKNFRPGRFQFAAILLGVVFQSWFLMLRGALERSCPIGTLSETLIFLSWAIGLFYLVIGPTYRISLMGTFTAPFILGLQCAALLLPNAARMPIITPSPFVEAHAALSLIAFGAFGLACVSAMMFLVQERQLKSQHPSLIFRQLPPINLLEKVTARLLWLGWVLLTISFAAGFLAKLPVSGTRIVIAFIFWGAIVTLLLARQAHHLSVRRFAALAGFVFLFSIIILFGIHFLSQ